MAGAAASRAARTAVEEALRSGSMTLAEVLGRCHDEAVGGIKVKAVLIAVPGLGKVKSHRLMEELGIPEGRRLAALEPNEQEALLAALS